MSAERADFRDWVAVMAAILGALMAALDISITNASLPQIQGEIGATGTEGTWITTSYLVAETVMIPLCAWLVRIFGLRGLLLSCSILFTVFSVICGMSESLNQMIFGRLGQGFFGGALVPTAMTVVALRLPPSQQALGMMLFGMTVMMGPIAGPVLGGWLTDNIGWYWGFFINIPVGVLLVTMIAYGFPRERWRLGDLPRADWFGIVGLSVFLGALTVVLEEGQREQWFESAEIVHLSLFSAAGFVMFVAAQMLHPAPVLKISLLRDRSFCGLLAALFFMGAGYFAVLYLLPVFLANIAGYDASDIGVIVMFSGLGSFLAIALYPWLSTKVDQRLIGAAGLVILAVSFWMDVALTIDSGGSQFIASQILRGTGMSLIFFSLNQAAMDGIRHVDVPDASGFVNMARNIGGSVGIALIAVAIDRRQIFHYQAITEALRANAAIASERLDAVTALVAMHTPDLAHARQQALQMIGNEITRQSLVMAYSDCFWLLAVGSVLTLPTLLLVRKVSGTGGSVAMH